MGRVRPGAVSVPPASIYFSSRGVKIEIKKIRGGSRQGNGVALMQSRQAVSKVLYRVTGARSVIFDGYGSDGNGDKIDLEVQRADRGADPHRDRYNSSVMDIENLDEGQDFRELPDTYTIFITEKDFFGENKPVHLIQRINTTTGRPFADGSYILYVNGEYRGEDDIGYLMHDFNCTDAADMHFPQMAERTRYLKENPEGMNEMCKVMEDMRDDARNEGMILGAISILKDDGLTEDEIVARASKNTTYLKNTSAVLSILQHDLSLIK